MALIIPVNSNPCRQINVPTPAGIFFFRTYWLGDVSKVWKMDILNGDSVAIASGMSLTHGVDNLVKGLGYTPLDGYRLRMVPVGVFKGTDYNTLGFSEKLVMFLPTETADDEANIVLQIVNGLSQ